MRHATAEAFAEPSGRTIATLSTPSQLDGLEAAWLELETTSQAPAFFQSYAWTRFVMSVREPSSLQGSGAEVESGAWQPRVVVVYERDKPALIWPLALVRNAGLSIIQDLTEPFGQYSDALISPGADGDAVLDAALDEISSWGADTLMFNRVRADAQLTPWLSRRAHRIGTTRQAPFVSFAGFSSFADYHKSIKAKTRKNLRNYRNRLSRGGPLVHRLVTDRSEISHLTRTCTAWRSEWLAASGLSSLAFRDPTFLKLTDELSSGQSGAPPLQLMLLERDIPSADELERVVAIQWGFRHGDRYYAFMSARNPAFDEYSPGRLHLEDVIEICAAQGIETVDMLAPEMPYKSTWATGHTAIDTYGLPMTLKGRLFIDVWHDTVRPRLKSAMLSLPRSVRRLAFGRSSQSNTPERD